MDATYKAINRAIELLLIGIFSLLVADVVWQVFSRYVLGRSYSFTEEFARFALIWLSLLGAAYLNGQQAHLSMDYFIRNLDKQAVLKRQRMIEGLMLFFALVVLIIGGGNLVYTTFLLGQKSPAMNVSLGYVYSIIPLSGILIMFYSLYHITHPKK